MDFKREVVLQPAFDKRDPDPKKNYGIHGCDMFFYLIKEGKAIQFLVMTGFHLPHVRDELREKRSSSCSFGADVGYHSPYPLYEGQEPMSKSCEVIGGTCYYDGSGIQGGDMFNLLCEKGSEAVWKKMEKVWESTFKKETQ